jgi:transcriptional regulator with GAF, ATPase, and Fis domain
MSVSLASHASGVACVWMDSATTAASRVLRGQPELQFSDRGFREAGTTTKEPRVPRGHAARGRTTPRRRRPPEVAGGLQSGGTVVELSVDSDQRFSREYVTQYARLFEDSPQMRAVRQLIEATAATDATVLIRGESGVGKDLVARAIHAASGRHGKPWVKVNCAAIPAELLEAELFGHERGAFTGATRRRLGKFEFANGGTLFLDEIGDLPRALQGKLLHVLQDFAFSRVGSHETHVVDVRVAAATNRDLEVAIRTGEFREDLYYRLNVVEVYVPPLRDRRDEIGTLAGRFVERFNAQYHRHVDLGPDMTALLTAYPWPGNVRELENVMRRLVVLADPATVRAELLRRVPDSIPPRAHAEGPPMTEVPTHGLKALARHAALAAERVAIQEVLADVRWNRVRAARVLKVSYKTLLTKMAAYGLGDPPRRETSGRADARRSGETSGGSGPTSLPAEAG